MTNDFDPNDYQGRSKKQVQYTEMVVNMILTLAVIGALVSLGISLFNIR